MQHLGFHVLNLLRLQLNNIDKKVNDSASNKSKPER